MKTRILLLFATIVLLTIAPAAMADGCFRCVPLPTPHCVNAFHVDGFTICFVDETGCHLDGAQCAPMGSEAALSSEYKVASVERIDEPQAPASPTPLVAPETEPPTR
jgi:hypothetical protein